MKKFFTSFDAQFHLWQFSASDMNDPMTFDHAKPDKDSSPEQLGSYFADDYLKNLSGSYQAQGDVKLAIQRRKNAGVKDDEIKKIVLQMFSDQLREKDKLVMGQARVQCWQQVRKIFYKKFRDDNSSPIAREHAMGALFADGREFPDQDCDFPDIDDDVFEWAMQDTWESGGKVASTYQGSLKDRWTKRGYSVFPPDRVDRHKKHDKQWGGAIVDVSTGKTTDDMSRVGLMATVLQQLQDRGVFVSGKMYASRQEMIDDFLKHGGDPNSHIHQGTLHLPLNDNPISTPYLNDVNHIILKLASSDQGVQYGFFYAQAPAKMDGES
jgi:hypothetical protein